MISKNLRHIANQWAADIHNRLNTMCGSVPYVSQIKAYPRESATPAKNDPRVHITIHTYIPRSIGPNTGECAISYNFASEKRRIVSTAGKYIHARIYLKSIYPHIGPWKGLRCAFIMRYNCVCNI